MKKVLVSGAYSLIGKEIVNIFLDNGYFVYATSTKKREENRENVKNIVIDFEDENLKLEDILKDITELDVLVNNAGVFTEGKTEELPLDLFHKVYKVNIEGLFKLTQFSIPLLKKSNGSVVNLSSLNAFIPGPSFTSHYDASKGFVSVYTQSLAKETGLRVNAVAPGLVETERLEGTDFAKIHMDHTVSKKLVSAKEIASTIYFLANSSGIYGETIKVDNGYTLI